MEEAPPSLRDRILAAVDTATMESRMAGRQDPSIHELLQELAQALLSEAKVGPPTHDTALTLLAADALITYACESVAEREPEKLSELP